MNLAGNSPDALEPLKFVETFDLLDLGKPWTFEPLLPLTPIGSMTLKVDHHCRDLGSGYDLPYSFTGSKSYNAVPFKDGGLD